MKILYSDCFASSYETNLIIPKQLFPYAQGEYSAIIVNNIVKWAFRIEKLLDYKMFYNYHTAAINKLSLTFPRIKKHSAGSLKVWGYVNADILEEARRAWTPWWKWRKIIFPLWNMKNISYIRKRSWDFLLNHLQMSMVGIFGTGNYQVHQEIIICW